jgi:hypothetical protein
MHRHRHYIIMQSAIPICAITQEHIRDAVIDPEGNTYEKSAILEWLSQHNVSPITRSELFASDLVPNRALMEIIEKGGERASSKQKKPDPNSGSGSLKACAKCNKMVQVSANYKGKKSPMCFACRPRACKSCTFLNDSNLKTCEMCWTALN